MMQQQHPPLLLDTDGEEVEPDGAPEWLVSLNTFEGKVYWNRRFGDLIRRGKALFTRDQPTPSLETRMRREVDPRVRICWNARDQWYELCLLLRVPLFIGPVEELGNGSICADYDVLYPLGPFRKPEQDVLALPNGKRPWKWHMFYPTEDLFEDCVDHVRQCANSIDRWQDLHDLARKTREKERRAQVGADNEGEIMGLVHKREACLPSVLAEGQGPNYGGRHFGKVFNRETA